MLPLSRVDPRRREDRPGNINWAFPLRWLSVDSVVSLALSERSRQNFVPCPKTGRGVSPALGWCPAA